MATASASSTIWPCLNYDAGATVVQDLIDAEHGSRGFTVSDPEGNLWSFGTYRGA